MKYKLCHDLINTTPTEHKKATIQYAADQMDTYSRTENV